MGSDKRSKRTGTRYKVKYIPDHELHAMSGALNDAVRSMGHETMLSKHFSKLIRAYILNVVKQRRPIYDVKRQAALLRNDFRVEKARFTRLERAWEAEKQALLGEKEALLAKLELLSKRLELLGGGAYQAKRKSLLEVANNANNV